MRLLLVGLLALAWAAMAKGQVVDMDIQPPLTTILVGQSVDVTIRVLAGSNHVDSVEADLNFDQTILQVVSITAGPLMGGGGATSFNNTTGQVNIALATGNPFEMNTFTLATVRFQGIAVSAGTPVSFNTTTPRISQASLIGVPYGGVFSGGTIVVAEPTVTPTNTVSTTTPTPTSTPTVGGPTSTVTPGGPTSTPTARPQDCCDCTNFALCVEGSCNVLCPDLTPPVLHRNEICFPAAIPGSGNCAFPSPLPGQVIIDEDTPTPTTVPRTPTRTPTSTRTATVTGTPPTATPTPTSSRQDCCECPEANCSIPPVNGTCPQGCTPVPNACCDCGPGGGGERPANTATPGGSGQATRPPTVTPTVRG